MSQMYSTYIGINVKCLCHVCQIVMELEYSRQILDKLSNIKFHEIHPVEAERSGETEGRTDGRAGRHKVVFRNFVNVSEDLWYKQM